MKPQELYLLEYNTCYLLHGHFLLGFFFDPEDSGDVILQNVA
jgi:hypothetical protein